MFPSPAERWLQTLFWDDPASFNQAAADLDDMTILLLMLTWVPGMKARYDQLGIPEEVFQNNLRDFPIWCHDNVDKYGKPCFRQWRWVAHSLRLELFRLGRLQFEPVHLAQDMTVGQSVYPAGTPMLSVHIPAGEALDPAAVQDAFQQAKDFFPR